MADNVVSRVRLPQFLQSFTLGFVASGMLADKLSPRITVGQKAGKYRVFGKNMLVDRSGSADWAPGAIPNAIDTRWSDDNYNADTKKLRQALLDAELNNNASPEMGGIDLAARYTQNVTMAMMVAREARIARLFTTAGNYPGANVVTKTGGAEWDAVIGTTPAVPLTDLITLAGTVADSAMVPSTDITVVIPQQVYRQSLQRNSAVLDAVKYTSTGVATPELLAALLGVKEVLLSQSNVAGAGPEKAGSDVISGYTTTNLWGDTVWAGVVAEGQNDMVAAFSRSFTFLGETGGQERLVRQYRIADEGQEGDWIEVKEAVDEKITFAAAGGIIKNVSSTY